MTAVILTIHVLIVLALIVVVLLQRSDGGALGLGGGGGGGFMTGRGAANALTRMTSLLAAGFFATSLTLALLAGTGEDAEDVIEELTGETAPLLEEGPAAPTTDDILDSLGGATAGEGEGDAPTSDTSLPLDEQGILDALGANDELPLPDASSENSGEAETAPEDDSETPAP